MTSGNQPRIPRTKRRVLQHIMEDRSIILFRSLLPEEWAVHEYTPDYGIDLVVEVFMYVDEARTKADTLGELFFVQLKSVRQTLTQKLVVRPRMNVEKTLSPSASEGMVEIEVIPFQLDIDELMTIQAMGSGVPVMLVLVCLDLNRAFFVCLNDYLEKIIIPEDPAYAAKGSKTIYIPVKNEIKNEAVALLPLRFYAKRSKHYAAFVKFLYQRAEVELLLQSSKIEDEGHEHGEVAGHEHQPRDSHLRAALRHFISVLRRLPIWQDIEMWAIVEQYRLRIEHFEAQLADPSFIGWKLTHGAWGLWHGLAVIGSNYEELCREWFLPTYLAQLTSYPD